MRDLGYQGVVSPEEAEEARDLLEENALLGDFSGDEEEDGYEYDDAGAEGGGASSPLTAVGRSGGKAGRGFMVGGELERDEREEPSVTKGLLGKGGSTNSIRSGRL